MERMVDADGEDSILKSAICHPFHPCSSPFCQDNLLNLHFLNHDTWTKNQQKP
jgi:hypothetical protein